MKCQYCKKNEADKVFYVNWMGGIYQIAMCEECMKKMWQKAGAAGQETVCPDCRLRLREKESLQPWASQVLYGIGGQRLLDGADWGRRILHKANPLYG